jgi:hypothetical protein
MTKPILPVASGPTRFAAEGASHPNANVELAFEWLHPLKGFRYADR